MSKVFVEYAINPEFRASFLIYMQGQQLREGHLELLEGTDQDGLYVEIWHDVTYEEYLIMKEERLNVERMGDGQHGDWERWIKGGISKLHMWHFSPANYI
ncbi:hypothetical protein ASG89_15935 [Paenibacillus sp. Soil766]|uniref:hypothetical protein n=1 Tax=Paenibacillus sp. Soil766 TaxID=1736404 RepID=UPI0007105559|nr:hypothetical protein [Paenibacillus sp. Soil766]KRF09701.1 hypothetical protein ASG89_15935 [Paenibacillus sp. Soil766]